MSVESTSPVVYRISANNAFKAEYSRTIRRASIVAVVLTFIAFLVWPEIHFTPYKLRQEELEVMDIQDQPEDVNLPPPPTEAPPPPKVIEAAADDEVTEDVEIADTFLDLDQALSAGMQTFSMGEEGGGFVVSQEKPIIIQWIKPEYPEMARLSQLQGTVIVKVLVGPDGNVMDAQVVKSVNSALDRAAIDAARRTKWKPGKQRNIPVKAWMALPYNFTLH
jgi:protein TonB